ncbi:MobC family plasmid mobilization relaxosome protein [Microbacterium sp. LMI1-1-1.1]|uniref:MobC family plasmid mobilization relaxosome protein n=1 Tax=Microbacterium sp. LMI1-1-1.1 TaxID=3135223 RepID=UPI003465863C
MSDETPTPRPSERRRRPNVAGGRVARHVVKASPEEEGVLLRLALTQGVTIPRLLVESALAQDAGETASERRATITKLYELHRLLAAISNNVNQIAKATNATHELHPETFATLAAVRKTAMRIDELTDELSVT